MITKKARMKLLLLYIVLNLIIGTLYSLIRVNQPTTLTQLDGTIVNVQVIGDHVYLRFHDENNHTIIQDKETWIWCWAEEDGKGGLKATQYPVHLHTPESIGISPGVNISQIA